MLEKVIVLSLRGFSLDAIKYEYKTTFRSSRTHVSDEYYLILPGTHLVIILEISMERLKIGKVPQGKS